MSESLPASTPPPVLPSRLRAGDVVRLVSPASTPNREDVERVRDTLTELGLTVQIARHAFDRYGFMAGRDEDRLADMNDALRDPQVRAVFATRGGKGAYRLADGLDFQAARRDPKLVVGFSDITMLHLALLKRAGLAAVHGACWDGATYGPQAAASFRRAILTTEQIEVCSTATEPTQVLTTRGRVEGRLVGGNQDCVATSAGWVLPSLDGAILLLEAVNLRLGHIDRQLTMLANAGHLRGLRGVAIGQYTDCGPVDTTQGDWTYLDVLGHHLDRWEVPVLGGLPIGHGANPVAVPIGTTAVLDADAGLLQIAPAVH